MLLRTLFLLIVVFQLISQCSGIGLAPGIYCGLETCYDVLEIPRDQFNKTELAKIYRRLARQFHPDRVRDPNLRESTEEKFRQIATAYETLKDDETREYYDYYLDHPEERYYNYYQYYRLRAAPKVDVRLVILVTILLISAFQFLSARQKHSEALKYAKEQIKFRNMAIDIAKERGVLDFDKLGKIKKKQKSGRDPEDIISEIIEENINISGGYKNASVYDTLVWQIVVLPRTAYHYLIWWFIWAKKYWIDKQEYDEEAKLYLIRKYLKLSEDQFHALEPKLHDEYLAKELWKKPEFDKWKEAKDIEDKEKQAKSGRYKQYQRYMKKNAGSTISFLED